MMALQRRERRIAAEAARRGSSLRQHVARAVRTLSERAMRRSAAIVPLEDPDLDESAAHQEAAVTERGSP
jgi:hypothetical protein